MVDFERLARPGVRELRAYDPGHDLVSLRRRFAEAQLVELGSNENPYGASPRAKQAIIDALAGIHIYPDPLGGDLKRALAAHHGVQPANLLLGNGSHELLMQFAQVFAGPGQSFEVDHAGLRGSRQDRNRGRALRRPGWRSHPARPSAAIRRDDRPRR